MNTQTLTSYLKLLACDGLGVINARKLLDVCKDVTVIFDETFLNSLFKVQDVKHLKKLLLDFKHDALIQEELHFIEKNNIQTVGILEENYPVMLKECADAPIVLFYKGNLDYLRPDCVAIVGTRKMSLYGKEMVQNLIKSIASYQPTIVSGMAYGVDICAYHEARKHHLKVVGVMGTSFKTLYPSAHKNEYYDLFENGLILTEYASFNTHVPELFTRRNRVIAGLCKTTVVIESAEKGGSLSTAYFANDYAREVYAIPGKINDVFSKGCLRLIHENRAQLLYDFNHLINDLNWKAAAPAKSKKEVKKELNLSDFTPIQQDILKKLQNESWHIDELAVETHVPMSVLNAELMMLELEGIVVGLPGKIFKVK